MVAIIDYSVGNLFSLKSSISSLGIDALVTDKEEDLKRADQIILPGVGAFSDAITKLKATGLDTVLIEEAKNGKRIMGICLGMQMLFEKSYEYGEYDGLSLLKGKVVPMEGYLPPYLKIPHIGWNALNITNSECPIFRDTKNGDCVYFVHSYFASDCDDSLAATTEYGKTLTAAVAKDNIFGCQFHPEKSGNVGLKILKAFCDGK